MRKHLNKESVRKGLVVGPRKPLILRARSQRLELVRKVQLVNQPKHQVARTKWVAAEAKTHGPGARGEEADDL